MNDGDRLLALILDPDTDADDVRLVYADWLDESGTDPLRAEFIRVQFALALHRVAWPGQAVPWRALARREVLERQEQGLLAGNNRRWALGLPGPLALSSETFIWEFRRGFVEAIRCSADDWLTHADAILAAQPVREVVLTTWPEPSRLFEALWPRIKFKFPLPEQSTRPPMMGNIRRA